MKKIFFKRILAYIIDCIILFLALLVVNLFVPTFGDINELNLRLTTMMEEYSKGEIASDEFLNESNSVNYDIMKATYISSIAGIVVYILYFVVYQAYNSGQTLGKKLMKIKILKNDGDMPDINCLFRRSLIPYGILVNFILVIVLLVTSKTVFININSVLSNLHMMVIFITIILMFTKGRGIQDYLGNTKVEEI